MADETVARELTDAKLDRVLEKLDQITDRVASLEQKLALVEQRVALANDVELDMSENSLGVLLVSSELSMSGSPKRQREDPKVECQTAQQTAKDSGHLKLPVAIRVTFWATLAFWLVLKVISLF